MAPGIVALALAGACVDDGTPPDPGPTRDVSYFLRRIHELEDLPRLGTGTSELASTWDREGGNDLDGDFYPRVEGDSNVLLDVDGPGCIHRISTGILDDAIDGTTLELRLDGRLVLELPAAQLFDPAASPFAGPLVFDGYYPTVRMPIPFREHAELRLVSPAQRWGRFWQIGYSRYPVGVDGPIETLSLPLDDAQQRALDDAGEAWLDSLAGVHEPSEDPSIALVETLAPGDSMSWSEQGCGTIERLELTIDPNWPAPWRDLLVRIHWDDAATPAVDLPVHQLLAGTEYGDDPLAEFDSLGLGAAEGRAYLRLPMPYREAASIELINGSLFTLDVELALWRRPCTDQPEDWGYFHATAHTAPAATADSPLSGPLEIPVHPLFEQLGRGKVVGTVLRVAWPYSFWWGEGDWQIWADLEFDAWPPSYHGTGTEEFYDGGWTQFDRRPLSGAVKQRPGLVTVYGFLLTDAFNFEERLRMQVETLGLDLGNAVISTDHPDWSSTVYWYSETAG